MGLLDKIFGGARRGRDDVDVIEPLPVGEVDGREVTGEDVVAYILGELRRRRDERCAYELQWTLNADFLAGHQNCDINMTSRSVEMQETAEKGSKERRVYNRIAPLMETRHANLKSVNYDMVVKPRTAELEDYAKARISSKILSYCQAITDFDRKKDKLIAWAELTGTAYTISYWDVSRGGVVGKRVTQEIGEDGNVSEREEDVRIGEIDFGLLSSYEVFPYSLTVQEVEDQPSIIIEQIRDVDEVFTLYGLKVDGDSLDNYVLTPIEGGVTGRGMPSSTFGMVREKRDNAVAVITYLENPSREYPQGRLITVIRDKIVYYGTLPGGIMPLVAVKSKTVAGNFFGKSVIQDLIPLQRTFNSIENKIVDFIDTVANNPWLVPAGCIENLDDIEENGIDSGSVIIYDERRGKPEIVQYPNPPSVIYQERDKLASDMEYIAGVSQLMVVGSAPSGVTSGTAIDNLREIDSTRMSLTADNIRDAVVAMAKIWLRINKTYARGYRVLKISGGDEAGYVYTWEASDINSYDVEYVAENELRHSAEQQRADFLQAFQIGLFNDERGRMPDDLKRRAWEMFKVGDIAELDGLDELQRKNADRENAYLEQGIIPQRGRYDDDEIHLEAHLKYAISNEYRVIEKRSEEYARMFDAHIAEHQAKVMEKLQANQMNRMQAAQGAQMQ